MNKIKSKISIPFHRIINNRRRLVGFIVFESTFKVNTYEILKIFSGNSYYLDRWVRDAELTGEVLRIDGANKKSHKVEISYDPVEKGVLFEKVRKSNSKDYDWDLPF